MFKLRAPMGSSMPESLVGAGGWGYFAGGLAAYAKAFRFAEVNATFYRRIPESMARRWRARVPADFVFSVKAHCDVTHAGRLQASAAGGEAVRVAFTFHGVRMYSDAARFLTFKRTGAFPAATSSRGLASLEAVLIPDARFPSSKDDLVQRHGWKVIDLDDHTRAHANRLLSALPRQTLRSLGDVVQALAAGAPDPKKG